MPNETKPDYIWALPKNRLMWTEEDEGHEWAIPYVLRQLYDRSVEENKRLRREIERACAGRDAAISELDAALSRTNGKDE